MRYSFSLLELLLVERNVVVLCNVLQGLKQIVFQVFLPLLLLNHDCPLKIQIIFFLKHVKKWRVSASINANLLELVPEVVLDWLLFEAVSLHDHVVLTFEDKTIDNEVFFLK